MGVTVKTSRLLGLGLILGLSILIQACCSPNACRYAKTGARTLEKSIVEVEKYKERNGRYPVVLDDIQKGFGPAAEKELQLACPECGDLQYRTDAYGYELQYQYRHMGPNWCVYTADSQKWNCRGNY
jgi:hypothetical protein